MHFKKSVLKCIKKHSHESAFSLSASTVFFKNIVVRFQAHYMCTFSRIKRMFFQKGTAGKECKADRWERIEDVKQVFRNKQEDEQLAVVMVL